MQWPEPIHRGSRGTAAARFADRTPRQATPITTRSCRTLRGCGAEDAAGRLSGGSALAVHESCLAKDVFDDVCQGLSRIDPNSARAVLFGVVQVDDQVAF